MRFLMLVCRDTEPAPEGAETGAPNTKVEEWVSTMGARGLRSICESILTDAMFELPSAKEDKFHLDLEYAQKKFDKSKMNLLKVA